MSSRILIPHGLNKRLYLYTDFRGGLAWAANLSDWRSLTGRHTGSACRAAYDGSVEIPATYRLLGKLANDGIERI